MKELYPEIAYWSMGKTACSKEHVVIGYIINTYNEDGMKCYVVEISEKIEGLTVDPFRLYCYEEDAKDALAKAITVANRKIKIENLLNVL